MRKKLILVFLASAFLALPLAAQRPGGAEIRIDRFPATNSFSPQVGLAPNGDFVVVWETGNPDLPREPPRVWFRLFRANGKPKTPQLRVGTGRAPERWPRLAMAADGSFLVVWQVGDYDTGVFGRRFNADGRPRGDRFRLSVSTEGVQEQPAAAFARDGSFVAVWVSQGLFWDVYARRFDAAGQPLGAEFLVNTATTAEEQDTPQVALNANGDFLIGWVSWVGEGGFFDVLARRFAKDGTPQSDEIMLNGEETARGRQDEFALAMRDDGAFVVIWTDRTNDPISGSLGGQRFTASGDPVGPPLRVTNPPSGSLQDEPAIAMAADGSFFAAWTNSGPSESHIAGRRFASDGTPLSGEIRIDRPPANVNYSPSIALGNDGRGIVVWLHYGSKISVFARRLVP